MPNVLSPEQIAAFDRDGYLSPITIMTPTEAARYRRELEAAEAKWPQALTGAGRNNAHMSLKFMDEIVHDQRILDVAEDLVGPDILAYATVLFIKEPVSEGFVSWHQDATYMGLTPHKGVTAWLALSPSNRQTGCMQMIPGSHKDGVRRHEDTFAERNILTRGQNVAGIDPTDAVDLVLEPGQMSLHHLEIVHGSQPNLGADRRIGVVIQPYMPVSNRQKLGPAFAQLVRGHDPHGNFRAAPRPSGDMDPSDENRRDEANGLMSDILYQGAEKRRDF